MSKLNNKTIEVSIGGIYEKNNCNEYDVCMGIILFSACPTPNKDDDKTGVDIATLMANIWEDDTKADCNTAGDAGNANKQAIAFEAGGVYYVPDFSDLGATATTCANAGCLRYLLMING